MNVCVVVQSEAEQVRGLDAVVLGKHGTGYLTPADGICKA